MKLGSRIRAWLDDRMGLRQLVDFNRDQLLKPVPARLGWAYTLGMLALFYFFLQFVTGFLLLIYYSPHPDVAYKTIQTIQHKVHYGWLVRQMHSWGASFAVFVLILHVLKVLWTGSYKRPREFTWFVGALLLLVTLGFSLTGYILPWNQVAKWATAVVTEGVAKTPLVGESLYEVMVGGKAVSGNTVGRFFAVHVFLLPLLLGGLIAAHLMLIRWKGISPKQLPVDEETDLGYEGSLEKVGAEPFFPRQVYREVFVIIIGFALLVTFATFFPWELGDPASKETPYGVKPEWFFLPVYQAIKYFDHELVAKIPIVGSLGLPPAFVGISVVNVCIALFFFLPLLDFGKQRKITRRPIFATIAFTTLLGVVGLGVLGELSFNTYRFMGREYSFDYRAVPTIRNLTPEEMNEEEEGATIETPEKLTPPVDPEWVPADLSTLTRADGQALGGTCVDCHDNQGEKWLTSIHAAQATPVECVDCHGGNDKIPENIEDDEDKLAAFAHKGMPTNEDGEAREPHGEEIVSLCGKCHSSVKDAFSERHLEVHAEARAKTCYSCHSNHKVVPTGLATFNRGYTSEEDPRTADFQAIRKLVTEWRAKRPGLLDDTLARLREHEYPTKEIEEQLDELLATKTEAERKISDSTHSLNVAEVKQAIATAEEAFAEDLRNEAENKIESIENRWQLVAGIWAITLMFASLLILKMRSFDRSSARRSAIASEPLAPLGLDSLSDEETTIGTPLDLSEIKLDPPLDEELEQLNELAQPEIDPPASPDLDDRISGSGSGSVDDVGDADDEFKRPESPLDDNESESDSDSRN